MALNGLRSKENLVKNRTSCMLYICKRQELIMGSTGHISFVFMPRHGLFFFFA